MFGWGNRWLKGDCWVWVLNNWETMLLLPETGILLGGSLVWYVCKGWWRAVLRGHLFPLLCLFGSWLLKKLECDYSRSIFFGWFFMNLLLWTSLQPYSWNTKHCEAPFFSLQKFLCVWRLHRWLIISKLYVQSCGSRKSDGFICEQASPHCFICLVFTDFLQRTWLSSREKNPKNQWFNTWNYSEKN